jgi:hypothetical protein
MFIVRRVEVALPKKLNPDEKQARKVGALATFVRQYTRKAQRGVEPNGRRYDRSLEKAVKRMPPDELDRLLREDGDEG